MSFFLNSAIPSQDETGCVLTGYTEEMDVIFGSEGTAISDYERQAEISREIGLDEALARLTNPAATEVHDVEAKA